MRELYAAGATVEQPIDLYRVGPALVAAGYSERAIVNALDSLVYEKRLEYAGGNRVRVTR